MSILIKNGRLINPATGLDKITDILIEKEFIKKIDNNITDVAEETIDAKGMWVTPGLIDVHVHLRDPGFTYKETIKTGCESAAMGGFTTICCMPNTSPVIDSDVVVEYINKTAQKGGIVNLLPIGAITKGQNGEELAEIGKMMESGICAISEDGKSVLSSKLLKTAMTYANMFNLPIFSHCEDKSLAGDGVMNAGKTAQLLGLKGISNDSEEVIVARDIILASSTKARLHICHVSTKGSIDILKYAKKRGIKVSAEVCPHHFSLCDEDIVDYNGNMKMNPPLRSKDDVYALKAALKDGTIEIIATDHAPHSVDEKNCEFEKVAFGIVGLETAIPLCITNLVDTNILTPMELIEKMTINPAKLLNIDKGSIEVGKKADIVIINADTIYKVDITKFKSKSNNSPFDGYEVKGKVIYTIVNGKIVMEKGVVTGGNNDNR